MEPESIIHLHLMNMQSETPVDIAISQSASVQELMNIVSEKFMIQENMLRLLFRGVSLDKSKTLMDYEILDGYAIHVLQVQMAPTSHTEEAPQAEIHSDSIAANENAIQHNVLCGELKLVQTITNRLLHLTTQYEYEVSRGNLSSAVEILHNSFNQDIENLLTLFSSIRRYTISLHDNNFRVSIQPPN